MTDYTHPDFNDPALRTLYCHECGVATPAKELNANGFCVDCRCGLVHVSGGGGMEDAFECLLADGHEGEHDLAM